MGKHFYKLLYLLIILQTARAQSVRQSINSDWEFHQGDIDGYPQKRSTKVEWLPITIPHSWNTTDVTDDNPGYYRGVSWYKKTLYVPSSAKNKQLYLYFKGINQVAEVYVNGHLAEKHNGGYTAFCFLIQPDLKITGDTLSANEILVKVDNSFNENIPPLDADFTFYGGIYRDVYLITANDIHFTLDDYASPGIKIKTPAVSNHTAVVTISGNITNRSAYGEALSVVTTISDANGRQLDTRRNVLTAIALDRKEFKQQFTMNLPHLWSPDDPYLYRVSSKIYDQKKGILLDEISSPLGLRWYHFDADKGFYLNGKPLKLIGASRHQDFKGMANALPDAMHERDMELLKNMGANFIRIAHYPQDPAVMEACDRLGLLASVEIPIVNTITQTKDFYNNCEQMQLEMIRQNFNHPSIIIWAYMNEVLLRPKYLKNSAEQDKYFSDIKALAKQIDALTHREDTERYTMIPCHGDFDLYQRAGLTTVPQLIGWNLYQGWYTPGLINFAKFMDHFHQMLPHTPMIVTEYGADADIRIHNNHPERFDKSIEYQTLFHEYYLKNIQSRPFVAGAAVWNLADFNSEQRKDATPHVNTKGITTDEREPKDAYFFYQANLLKSPFLKIGSSGWRLRTGVSIDGTTCIQPVYVFSNGGHVRLWHNGKPLKSKQPQSGVAVFDIPFTNGINSIKAVSVISGKVCEDIAEINFKLVPPFFKNKAEHYQELNISLGDKRFFVDEKSEQVWLPAQPYKKGSWGYIGGRIFTMTGQTRQPFGSDKDIYGTDLDPVYQTQRIDIKSFKFDVTDGEYDITLGFAELEGKNMSPALAYNLGDENPASTNNPRAFDIYINGKLAIKSLSTQSYLLPQRKYSTTIRISATNNTGITVDFKPLTGEAILNTIQLKQVY